MAKQLGSIRFSGKLGPIIGYQRDGVHYIRMGGGPSPSQWRNSPRMIRSRENAAIFGGASMLAALIYRGLPKPLYDLCGPYTHNRLAATLVKAARHAKGGRLPKLYPAQLAAAAVQGMDIGSRHSRHNTSSIQDPKKRHAAEQHATQVDAKQSINISHNPSTGRIDISGLALAASRIPLHPKERLEVRVHLYYLELADLELQTLSLQPGYAFPEGKPHAHRLGATTAWLPWHPDLDSACTLQAACAIDELSPDTPPSDVKAMLIIAAVEWRAMHGLRPRVLKGAGLIRIVGALHAPGRTTFDFNDSSLQRRNGPHLQNGSRLQLHGSRLQREPQKTRRAMLLRWRERTAFRRDPAARFRSAIRSLEIHNASTSRRGMMLHAPKSAVTATASPNTPHPPSWFAFATRTTHPVGA